MEQQARETTVGKDARLAGLIASTAVITGFVIYWSVQIQAVLEMLELAYG